MSVIKAVLTQKWDHFCQNGLSRQQSLISVLSCNTEWVCRRALLAKYFVLNPVGVPFSHLMRKRAASYYNWINRKEIIFLSFGLVFTPKKGTSSRALILSAVWPISHTAWQNTTFICVNAKLPGLAPSKVFQYGGESNLCQPVPQTEL